MSGLEESNRRSRRRRRSPVRPDDTIVYASYARRRTTPPVPDQLQFLSVPVPMDIVEEQSEQRFTLLIFRFF